MSSKKLEFKGDFDSFPLEIYYDIFLRLPIKCLIGCTAVCKSWRSVIKNPSFIHSHMSFKQKSNDQNGTQLLLLHGWIKRGCISWSKTGCICDIIEEFYSLHYDNSAFNEYCKIKLPSAALASEYLRVVGTCNGLVCLVDVSGPFTNTIIVSNPSIRKSVTLPEPNVTRDLRNASVGFGFDAVTNDYKVVRLVSDGNLVEVYSLATGSWSRVPSIPFQYLMDAHTPQAFVNGALHWLAKQWKEDDLYYFILIFDVGRGLFSETIMPESLKNHSKLTLQLSTTGDGKSIALFKMDFSRCYGESYFDIWLMREYCIPESWIKMISLDPLSWFFPGACSFRRNSELVLYNKQLLHHTCSKHSSCPGYELFSLDLESQQYKSLGVCGYSYYTVNTYDESLVLLDMENADSY